MILAPVTVNDTSGGVVIVTPSQAIKTKAIVIQNLTGSSTIALSFDGGEEALTFANGLVLEAGMERVIESPVGGFHNNVLGIANTGTSSTLRVHLIE